MSARPIGKLGRYTLLREIAQGGMARVFLARRHGSNDPCVVKQLHVELESNPTAAKRFQREAHIVSRLDHPNIAKVVGAGMEGSTFCIAMEVIAGQTVEALMIELSRRGDRLPPSMTVRIVASVLEATAYAHELTDEDQSPLHIVHRDLSPRNVMVSYDDEIKVIDFGVAHGRIDSFQTAPGMMVGTLRYMSPEQAMAGTIDARSDLYTIGVVLHEMLAGQPAITDSKAVDVLNRVINEPLPELTSLAPELPKALSDVIRRATQKESSDRFQSARQMRQALLDAAATLEDEGPQNAGALARSLFPDHAKETETWFGEGFEDSLDHPTLSEMTPPPVLTPVPEVRAPSVRNSSGRGRMSSIRERTGSIREPRAPSLRESAPTLTEATPPTAEETTVDEPRPTEVPTQPPPPSRARRTSSKTVPRRTTDIRLRALEQQLRRWRSAVFLLLFALTTVCVLLVWVLAKGVPPS